jgi:hypothetical protein
VVSIFETKRLNVHTNFPKVKSHLVVTRFGRALVQACPAPALNTAAGRPLMNQPFLAIEIAGNEWVLLLMLMPSPPSSGPEPPPWPQRRA